MQEGWECPRCRRIYSPYTQQCTCQPGEFYYNPGPGCMPNDTTLKPEEKFKTIITCEKGE